MILFSLKFLKLDKLPTSPGVYFFLSKTGRVLYIGKAANLRLRIKSYFLPEVSEKTSRLLKESTKLKVEETKSEIEALLKEAAFIKKIQPKYNILWRDDKNYFFAGITQEEFPKVFITHQPTNSKYRNVEMSSFIGPFVSGRALKNTLKLIRHYFPYCTCKKPHKRRCLQSQLGLCYGFCCEANAKVNEKKARVYQENIKSIKLILSGRKNFLAQDLKKRIEKASTSQNFETAAFLKSQLQSLEKIFSHKGLLDTSFLVSMAEEKETAWTKLATVLGQETLEKIEVYDISMISGKYAVGAMIAFAEGKPEKASWRLFKIKQAKTQDDPAMLAEIVKRRFSHPEWHFPDFIFVDGGKSQLNSVRSALKNIGTDIPSASLAKSPDRKSSYLLVGKPIKKIPLSYLPKEVELFLKKLQDTVHRFTISYHRLRRGKTLLPQPIPKI